MLAHHGPQRRAQRRLGALVSERARLIGSQTSLFRTHLFQRDLSRDLAMNMLGSDRSWLTKRQVVRRAWFRRMRRGW